jgi:hypothetical protein
VKTTTHGFAARDRFGAARVTFDVSAIGYLVPAAGFVGRVHSVFSAACNVRYNDTWLTIAARRVGDGPATLRLADDAAPDLRLAFNAGEAIGCHGGVLRSAHVELSLRQARVWQPTAPMRLLTPEHIDARLRDAAAVLAHARHAQSSVLGREGATTVAALRDACGTLDIEAAMRHTARMIGWGEGLTPAGDDFLVGLLAGLDAFVDGDGRRARVRGAIAAVVTSGARRTTPIAAHYLTLAAGGHYNEPIVGLRHALLAEDDGRVIDAVLRRALAIGATSGADTAHGLLTGLAAWSRHPPL